MMFHVIVFSAAYSDEEFDYETLAEARAGIKRLKANAKKYPLSVKRSYIIEEKCICAGCGNEHWTKVDR